MTLIENIYADRQLLVLLVATVIATVGLFIVPLYSITKLVKRKLSKLPTASHPSEQTPPGRGRSVLFLTPLRSPVANMHNISGKCSIRTITSSS